MPVGYLENLLRRGSIFYFRRAVPRRLWGRFGRREIKFSLKTTELSVAKVRCRRFSNRFEQLVEAVGTMPSLGKDKIEQLIRIFFTDLLSRAEEHAFLLPQDDTVDLDAEAEGLDEGQSKLRKQIASRKYDGVTRVYAEEVLETLGGDGSKPDGEDFDALCNGILRARLEQYRILAAMLRGEYKDIAPVDPLFLGVVSPGMPPLPGEDAGNSAISVSVAIQKYCDLKRKFDWTKKTYGENRRVLDWFAEFVGASRKVATISVDEVREFRDVVVSLPAHFALSKEFEGKSLKEIAAIGTEGRTLAKATIVKYMGGVKGFFAWCEDEDLVATNPALKIKITKKANTIDARHPFSTEQLRRLFKSPMYTGHRSASRRSIPGDMVIRDGKFWVPLIALFTGMRMSEIIQMRVADVKEEDGVTYFDVSDEGTGKSLKTGAAKRVIPLHPELVGCGLLDHVAAVRSIDPSRRIFEDIKPGKNGEFSHNYSKFFRRYIELVEVKSEKVTFHSLRHNFKDALRQADVEDSRQDALMGHSDKSVASTYGTKYTAAMLRGDVEKIAYPVDLAHLHQK